MPRSTKYPKNSLCSSVTSAPNLAPQQRCLRVQPFLQRRVDRRPCKADDLCQMRDLLRLAPAGKRRGTCPSPSSARARRPDAARRAGAACRRYSSAPSRRSSISLTSKPSSPRTASFVSARRVCASGEPSASALCGGTAAGMTITRSSPSAARHCAAASLCPFVRRVERPAVDPNVRHPTVLCLTMFCCRFYTRTLYQGPMPSAAVRDEGALQMRPAPCGYSSACVLRPHFLFSSRKGNGVARQRKRGLCETESTSRSAIASEEASSIPFPAGAAKTPYLQPSSSFPNCDRFTGSQFGHLNFTTPHAILMMAGRRLLSDTVKTETFLRRKSRARLWSMESQRTVRKVLWSSLSFLRGATRFFFFLRIEKEKNGVTKFPQLFSCCCFLLSMAALTAASWKYSFCFCFRSRSCSFRRVFDTLTGL